MTSNKVAPETKLLREFLEYMEKEGIVLAKEHQYEGLFPYGRLGNNELIAKFFANKILGGKNGKGADTGKGAGNR